MTMPTGGPCARPPVAARGTPQARSPLTRGAHWPWVAAVALVPVTIISAAIAHESWWRVLGVDHMRPYFLDLVAILAAGQAFRAGLNVYAPNPLDPLHRPHVYGPLWLLTGDLGLKISDAPWLGFALLAVSIAAAAALLAPRNLRQFVVAAALLSGPPVLLAFERGNNDLVVFLLLAGSAWLLAGSRPARIAGGSGLLLLAAVLKMYPLVGLPVIVAGRGRRIRGVVLAGVLVLCGAVAWAWRQDYLAALALAPRPNTIFSYGFPLTELTWRALGAVRPALFVGAFLAALAWVPPLVHEGKQLWRSVPLGACRGHGFVLGALCWVSCYVLTNNYPYRLVLLWLPAALWLARWSHRRLGASARIQLAGWVVVFWLALAKHALGDASLRPHAPGTVETLFVLLGFEQTTVLLLTLAIVVALAGWLFRVARRTVRLR